MKSKPYNRSQSKVGLPRNIHSSISIPPGFEKVCHSERLTAKLTATSRTFFQQTTSNIFSIWVPSRQ